MILEFSQSVVTLPDEECSGLKPTHRQTCIGRNCSSIDGKVNLPESDGESKATTNGSIAKQREPDSMNELKVDFESLTEQRLNSDQLQLDRLQMLNQLSLSNNDVDTDSEERGPDENDVLGANAKTGIAKAQPEHKWMTTGYSQCTASCLGGTFHPSQLICVQSKSNVFILIAFFFFSFFFARSERVDNRVRSRGHKPTGDAVQVRFQSEAGFDDAHLQRSSVPAALERVRLWRLFERVRRRQSNSFGELYSRDYARKRQCDSIEQRRLSGSDSADSSVLQRQRLCGSLGGRKMGSM